MQIVIGSDHAGFELKEALIRHLEDRGVEVSDLGPPDGAQSVDYPDYAEKVARGVLSGGGRGVLVCGTGIGMSIAANRFQGIRAALVHDRFTAQMAGEHNDANVLVLGGRVLDHGEALGMVEVWMDASFEARHQRRLDKASRLGPA